MRVDRVINDKIFCSDAFAADAARGDTICTVLTSKMYASGSPAPITAYAVTAIR